MKKGERNMTKEQHSLIYSLYSFPVPSALSSDAKRKWRKMELYSLAYYLPSIFYAFQTSIYQCPQRNKK